MANLIALALSNFTLTFLILGFIAAALSLAFTSESKSAPVVREKVFSFFLLFSIGFSFFYNFVVHVFFGNMAAHFIGWQNSPFQAEVGYASLGFSVVGFLAFRGSRGMRVAGIIGPALFLLGAAGGHIAQMIRFHNFAPGNTGVILYTDLFLPVLGFVLLWLEHRDAQRLL